MIQYTHPYTYINYMCNAYVYGFGEYVLRVFNELVKWK